VIKVNAGIPFLSPKKCKCKKCLFDFNSQAQGFEIFLKKLFFLNLLCLPKFSTFSFCGIEDWHDVADITMLNNTR